MLLLCTLAVYHNNCPFSQSAMPQYIALGNTTVLLLPPRLGSLTTGAASMWPSPGPGAAWCWWDTPPHCRQTSGGPSTSSISNRKAAWSSGPGLGWDLAVQMLLEFSDGNGRRAAATQTNELICTRSLSLGHKLLYVVWHYEWSRNHHANNNAMLSRFSQLSEITVTKPSWIV